MFALAALTVALLSSAAPAVFAADPSSPMIVILERDADVDSAVSRGRRDHKVKPSNTFRHAARGYAAELTRAQVRAIEKDPAVQAVVPDAVVELTAQSTPAGIRRVQATKSPIADIDGVDERVSVDVAIIDTGIQPNHPDLRVVGGYDCTRSGTATERSSSARWKDEHGHGTHVAGIVGAKDNSTGVVGVAPGARLWSVRVFDAVGYSRISWIACGIDWVTSKRDPADSSKPLIEVANMSLRDKGGDDGNCGYTIADIEHQAICRSVARGITYVVAAGNDRGSAIHWRPGSFNEVITVSAMADYDGKSGGLGSATCTSFGRRDADDTFADFSNYGKDVDLIAPGVCVRSTYKGSTYALISGTSMATPAVAGGAALYKVAHPTATPSEVRAALRAAGLFDWRTSTDPDGNPDPLLDVSSFGAGAGLRLRNSVTTARVWPGKPATSFTTRLTRLDGHSGTASLSVADLPAGMTASFSKSSFNGRDFGASTVALQASGSTRPGTYTVQVTATSGSIVGKRSLQVIVEIDNDAPAVSSVRNEIAASPSTASRTATAIRTRWAASDAVSGVARSTVDEKRNSGSWKTVATTGSTSRSRIAFLPYDTTIQHRVRATDQAGNTGAYVYGNSFAVRRYGDSTALASWSSGWVWADNSTSFGGEVRASSKAGASVTVRFAGKGIGWISRTGPTRGKARVYVDGVLVKTVDTHGPTRAKQVVFAANHLSNAPHTLKIVVLGTSGRPRVDVDGFVVLR
jgi:subtilisin family serine protease